MTYFYTQLPILSGSLLTAAKLRVKYTVCGAVILIFYTTASGLGSVVGIVAGYGLMVRGSNPGGGEIFCTCPDWP